jgi:mandelamide amidase
MARTLEDCALLYAGMAGGGSAVAPRSLAGVRVGVSARGLDLDADVAAGFEESLAACRRLGAELVDAPTPRDTLPDWGYVFDAEIHAYHRRFDDRRDLYRASTREFVERGAAAETSRYHELQARRDEDRAWWETWFAAERVAALVEPTVPDVAWIRGPGYDHAGSDVRLIELTHHWDWTGMPVVALPAGVGPRSGLPVGISLVGPSGSDRELLALGITLQVELGIPEPPAYRQGQT